MSTISATWISEIALPRAPCSDMRASLGKRFSRDAVARASLSNRLTSSQWYQCRCSPESIGTDWPTPSVVDEAFLPVVVISIMLTYGTLSVPRSQLTSFKATWRRLCIYPCFTVACHYERGTLGYHGSLRWPPVNTSESLRESLFCKT